MRSQHTFCGVLRKITMFGLEKSSLSEAEHTWHGIKFSFQVASELNAAILEVDATPKLANLLKLLLWSQEEIDKKKIKYPRMTDIASGTIDDPK